MKLVKLFMSSILVTALISISGNVGAYSVGEELTGDPKFACEAILCLATSTKPSECEPSLERYFGIKMRKPHETFRARLNFLNLCPKDSNIDKETLAKIGIDLKEQNENMDSLTNAVARLPHECQADTLNSKIESKCVSETDNGNCDSWVYRVKPKMPKACTDLANHKWTRIKLPVYKGDYNWYKIPKPVWVDDK